MLTSYRGQNSPYASRRRPSGVSTAPTCGFSDGHPPAPVLADDSHSSDESARRERLGLLNGHMAGYQKP